MLVIIFRKVSVWKYGRSSLRYWSWVISQLVILHHATTYRIILHDYFVDYPKLTKKNEFHFLFSLIFWFLKVECTTWIALNDACSLMTLEKKCKKKSHGLVECPSVLPPESFPNLGSSCLPSILHIIKSTFPYLVTTPPFEVSHSQWGKIKWDKVVSGFKPADD